MSEVRFEVAFPDAKQVYVAGDFNDWDPQARRMKCVRRSEGLFVARMELTPGAHEFRYVVDGNWVCCPKSDRVSNDQGTENSVIQVEA